MDKPARAAHAPRKPDIPPDQEEFCPWCGLTRRELYASGRLGCARCYETFAREVEDALREIHGEDRHIGKVKTERDG